MTPSPSAIEHLFVLAFAVLYPVLGFINFRRLVHRYADRDDVPRFRLYASTVAGHCILCGAGLWLWVDAGRPLTSLGFRMGMDAGVVIGVVPVAAVITLLLVQVRNARTAGGDYLDRASRAFGSLRLLLPHDLRELHSFYAVGLTAGIVEEVLWRGYLLAYLTHYVPVAVAALVVIIGFGVAHAYQGWRAIPKITAVGAAFTGLFLLTDSLWLPIVLHVSVDVLQGKLAFTVIRRRGGGTATNAGQG